MLPLLRALLRGKRGVLRLARPTQGKHAREPAGLPRCARTLGQPYGAPGPPAAAVHALCPPCLDPTRRRRGRLRRPVRGGVGPLPHLAPPAWARPRWVQHVRRQPEAHRTAGLCEGGDTDAAGASRHQPPEAGPQASSRWPRRVPRASIAVRALHHASPLALPEPLFPRLSAPSLTVALRRRHIDHTVRRSLRTPARRSVGRTR